MSQQSLDSQFKPAGEQVDAGLIVLGSINIDLVVSGQTIPKPGETVTGGSFFKANGGKGANQAVAAARGGLCPVHLVGAVGNDQFGSNLLPELEAESRLDTSYIRAIEGVETGIAVILVGDDGENCISVAPGANHAFDRERATDGIQNCITGCNVLLACTELPLDTVRAGLEIAKSNGLLSILNPAPVIEGLQDESLLTLVDIITPNEHEAAQLTGIDVTDVASAEKAGRILQEKGVNTVLITMGESGVMLIDQQVMQIPAPTVVATDTTAAGDCFNGVFAALMCESADLATSAEHAVKAASISVTRPGAQPSIPIRHEFL
ncbi:MAG TPA: ribokinase [Planctomycetaceae bacterium]|nr:ribokinase [Pirellulales bacterium]HAL13733.1 ribokinase [Planctomycetaceae bacterium]HCK71091.1 ribokinase [Planctomycetaceae bacterium]|tara:strand:- start:236 stop:1198 length:963 start_codon:yes stop_codon:yes gene_type:complete